MNKKKCILHWATGWTIGVLGFDSRRGLGIFLFTTTSRPALVPTQPPIQCVPGALSLGLKRPRREDDHSPPSSAKVKEWVELYLHSPNMLSWRVQLKHRDKFYLYAYSLFCLYDVKWSSVSFHLWVVISGLVHFMKSSCQKCERNYWLFSS
jgi:hypothetical protein